MPLPQVALNCAAVSIVQFDQMYRLPIRGQRRFGTSIQRLLPARPTLGPRPRSCVVFLRTRTVTPCSDTGYNVED